jgi:serine O-acetyltransferase
MPLARRRGSRLSRVATGVAYCLLRPGVQAVAAHRLAHWLDRRGVRLLPGLVSQLTIYVTGCEIGPRACIGPGLVIQHAPGMVVHGAVRAGAHLNLLGAVVLGVKHPGREQPECPTIGDRVTIGAGAKVLGATTLGDGCTIGANAVVTRDVPAGALAVGVPAQIRTSPAS